jgi:hypothetical protein
MCKYRLSLDGIKGLGACGTVCKNIFIPYTDRELVDMRIRELKGLLSSTDYKILKVVEGATTLSEIAEVILQRAEWRKEINELERGDKDG